MKRKGVEQYDRIVEVSVNLFEKKGYRNTTMREIAKKTGLNQGSLYYYFKSKSDILYEIYLRMMKAVVENQERLMNMELPEDEKIKEIIKNIISVIAKRKGYATVFYRDHNALSPSHLKSVKEFAKGYRKNLEKIFENGIKKNLFKDINPALASLALVGMSNWAYMWLKPDGRFSVSEISKIFSGIFLEGITKKEEDFLGRSAEGSLPGDGSKVAVVI
jgi:AcrR family transcriptional regulator